MREIALDTETTGLSASGGDRIVEIGCVEIIDKVMTQNSFHVYLNPERDLSQAAQEISGLTYDFLKDFQKFPEVAQDFLDFIGDSKIVIHNAPFDVGFLNMELEKAGHKHLRNDLVIDTLVMAKQKFPGSPATLDALCKRFSINASKRVKHGALIDAELLAEVYIVMSVELKQIDILSLNSKTTVETEKRTKENLQNISRILISDSEFAQHQEFLKKIKNPIWNHYISEKFDI